MKLKASFINPDINVLPQNEIMSKLVRDSLKSMEKFRRRKLVRCQECMKENKIEHMIRRGTGFICRNCM